MQRARQQQPHSSGHAQLLCPLDRCGRLQHSTCAALLPCMRAVQLSSSAASMGVCPAERHVTRQPASLCAALQIMRMCGVDPKTLLLRRCPKAHNPSEPLALAVLADKPGVKYL